MKTSQLLAALCASTALAAPTLVKRDPSPALDHEPSQDEILSAIDMFPEKLDKRQGPLIPVEIEGAVGLIGDIGTAVGIGDAVAGTPRSISDAVKRGQAAKRQGPLIPVEIEGAVGLIGDIGTAVGIGDAVAGTPRAVSDAEKRELVARGGWGSAVKLVGQGLGALGSVLGVVGNTEKELSSTPRAISDAEKRSKNANAVLAMDPETGKAVVLSTLGLSPKQSDKRELSADAKRIKGEMFTGLAVLGKMQDYDLTGAKQTRDLHQTVGNRIESKYEAEKREARMEAEVEVPSGLRILADVTGIKSTFKMGKRSTGETTKAIHTSDMTPAELREGVRQIGEAAIRLSQGSM